MARGTRSVNNAASRLRFYRPQTADVAAYLDSHVAMLRGGLSLGLSDGREEGGEALVDYITHVIRCFVQ